MIVNQGWVSDLLDRLTETLDEIDTDIIQCFVDRLTEKLDEIDRDIIQCFVDRLTETPDEINTDIIQFFVDRFILRHRMKSIKTSFSVL